jgi:hypothetical protein
VWVVTTIEGAHVCRFLAEWLADEVIVVQHLQHNSSTCAWVGICNTGTRTLLRFDLCPAVACFKQLQAGNTTKRTHNSKMPHINLCTVLWTQSMTPFYWQGYVVQQIFITPTGEVPLLFCDVVFSTLICHWHVEK